MLRLAAAVIFLCAVTLILISCGGEKDQDAESKPETATSTEEEGAVAPGNAPKEPGGEDPSSGPPAEKQEAIDPDDAPKEPGGEEPASGTQVAAEAGPVSFTIVADTNTAIPSGSGSFSGFGRAPSIDDNGNVVFCGIGAGQQGIYTHSSGSLAMVADTSSLLPGQAPGGTDTFTAFGGGGSGGCDGKHSIDDGMVAFLANIQQGPGSLNAMFTNAPGGALVEIGRADHVVGSFDALSVPWISGPNVAFIAFAITAPGRGGRSLMVYDSTTGLMAPLSVADLLSCPTCTPAMDNPSIAGNAVTSRRVTTGLTSLVIVDGAGGIDELVSINVTPIPGLPGQVFGNFSQVPSLDNNGDDIAFWGTAGGRVYGVYKRIGGSGGSLEKVADTNTLIPDGPLFAGGSNNFSEFAQHSVSLADGSVAFLGFGGGGSAPRGIYTDSGGTLNAIVDVNVNKTITAGGDTFEVTGLSMGAEGLGKTPAGYALVFFATLKDGRHAIIRADISVPGTLVTAEPREPGVDAQLEALRRLEETSLSPLYVRFEDGLPRFVAGRVPIPGTLPDDPVVQALDFLQRFRELYRLDDPGKQLFLHRIRTDEIGQHLFFGQRREDTSVFAAELAVHLAKGEVVATNGNYLPDVPSFPPPELDAREAEAIALQDAPTERATLVGESRLMYFNDGIITGRPAETHLAWRVMVRGLGLTDGAGTSWRYLVDAHDGRVLSAVDQSRSDAPDKDFDIDTVNNTVSGGCWGGIFETSNDNWFNEDGSEGYPGPAADPFLDGQNAFDFSHQIYDYFFTTFHRHSWDDDEGDVEVMVHWGPNQPNAAYVPDCDHLRFSDSFVTDDVFAHEFTHAVTRWSSDLLYQDQPGALNESYSDVLAAMVDPDWTIGETMPAGAIRDMSNPP